MMGRPLFPVRFHWSDIVLQSYASDVSESDMFVACPQSPPEKTRLSLRLYLPDGREPEEVDAVVRSVSEGDRTGFVCELVRLTPSGRERLRGAIPRAKTPRAAPTGASSSSSLRDIVMGALDEGEDEAPVSKLMISAPRPLPSRAVNTPQRETAPPPKVIPVLVPETDRRAAPRAAMRFKVTFADPHKFVDEHAEDISAGGIFLATSRSVPVGTLVQLTLGLPDGGEPVETQARVARIAGPQDGRAGLGLQFVGRDPQLSSRILRMVESCSVEVG
jgi:uncharacterized protein (TIGR02266 family)